MAKRKYINISVERHGKHITITVPVEVREAVGQEKFDTSVEEIKVSMAELLDMLFGN